MQEVESVVGGEMVGHVLEVEGVEARLRLAQRHVEFRSLQHLMGMGRADAQRESAIDDVFAQSQCQVDDAFVGTFVADGVVVDRTGHTRNLRIEAVAVLCADHLLQNDGHLLLVDDVRRGGHVVLRRTVEDAGIHRLDRIAEHVQPQVFVVGVGHHVRRVDAGEGLVVAVLQERR